MANSTVASASARKRVRFSFAVCFDTVEERKAFKSRLEYIRTLLTPVGQPVLDNHGVMAAMFDHVEQYHTFPGSERASAVQSFNRSSGEFLTKHKQLRILPACLAGQQPS